MLPASLPVTEGHRNLVLVPPLHLPWEFLQNHAAAVLIAEAAAVPSHLQGAQQGNIAEAMVKTESAVECWASSEMA